MAVSNGASADVFTILARNVRAGRLRLGMTIDELAERAELDVLALDAVEGGRGERLAMLGLAKLAQALSVPPSELITQA